MSAAPPPRLAGASLFMSASVPAAGRDGRFHRIADAAEQIEQAVVSLARAVLAEGGRLVFGGHPAISPLVAIVAGEYRRARVLQPGAEAPPAPVVIYQSTLFRKVAPEATLHLFDLGLAEVRWIDHDPGESFEAAPRTGPRWPLSLARMRRAMLAETRPDAMVAIGGMEGVIDEARLYREMFPGRAIYVLASTGGASALLADEIGPGALDIVDERVMRAARATAAAGEAPDSGASADDARQAGIEPAAIPWPLIMQTIVAELAERRS